ncbi:MAG: two-component system, OmpR family, response regulator MprA [Chloroflexota bacterium]|jgi:two-component system response regulator MprA|nr:two-component system, OmpR family, response regulator MprA [Chloroflexota bacterium]
MPAQILVIDDDPKITQMLRRALTLDGYAVETAGSGAAGLDAARATPPDLVVLDVLMPEIDGLEVCRRLRQVGDTPILLLTAKDEVEDRVRGLDSGADDYVVKPFALEELLARIRALLRRHEPVSNETLRYEDLTLDMGTRTAWRGGREILLSTTEFELLHYFLRHPRRVLTRDAILNAVWGDHFERPTNVVEVYMGYLRAKLEANDEPRLLQTVRGAGYVLREG